jgi:hypothetical protein
MKYLLNRQRLPVEKMGEASMCMEQFYKLIGSCRLPNRTKDDFRIFQTNSLDTSRTNHITIMYKNRVRQRHRSRILSKLLLILEKHRANIYRKSSRRDFRVFRQISQKFQIKISLTLYNINTSQVGRLILRST